MKDRIGGLIRVLIALGGGAFVLAVVPPTWRWWVLALMAIVALCAARPRRTLLPPNPSAIHSNGPTWWSLWTEYPPPRDGWYWIDFPDEHDPEPMLVRLVDALGEATWTVGYDDDALEPFTELEGVRWAK